ncbi:MAG TPA: ssl1498 family light-harvesting-like protein [Leptolyngbyaceae cyanobacterium M33_DOE_097]|uniref:Ssl1498 family light-harvesting-like protein n=1 Tax=Oscillatoriales cyanobacterium SpSt-418 TaxID=2282169 RepID=A0A7C3PIZ2_9CYAN|nr:ssl1498 family light-harvesting-like protein [Leptolyngbyaceae cyanobacterium M33_DOE_097]
MSYTKTQGKTLNQAKNHYSDGTELIPAEVQANIRREEAQSVDIPFAIGYTIDDEGLVNNFAIEPDIYLSNYPSPRQQRQYLVLGAAAFFFVVTLLLTTVLVS